MQNVYINYVLICQPEWPNEMIFYDDCKTSSAAIGKTSWTKTGNQTIQWKLWFSRTSDVLFHFFAVWFCVLLLWHENCDDWKLQLLKFNSVVYPLFCFFFLNEKDGKKGLVIRIELDTNSMQWFVIFQNDHFECNCCVTLITFSLSECSKNHRNYNNMDCKCKNKAL